MKGLGISLTKQQQQINTQTKLSKNDVSITIVQKKLTFNAEADFSP